MIWADGYSQETLHAAWTSVNGQMQRVAQVDYDEFIYRATAAPLKTTPLSAFEALCPENTCQLDPANEELVAELVKSAGLKTLEPQQPVVLGQFHDRHVILTGNTRYRAALQLNSDIRYLCINFNDQTMCSTCWSM
jgi:hypothetical protein